MATPPRTTIALVPMTEDHAPAVMAIYQQGIDEGNATFETAAPPWSTFDTAKLPAHRLVALDRQRQVVGWTAVSGVSARPAYAGVVEHSVYVCPTARGAGVGRALLEALIVSTEKAGIWTIQAGIFPENAASLALHESVGFRVLGRRERVARHHGVWRDVLLVERRSPVVE
ncbi:GNAT family N-acetyltransferase [Streptomyces sp. NPDC058718]|uniref:GNAT family N-acetyltransferase n=1 Tax=Streptomyces sp. NPDC058718 TaxID=3346610 RepID=UPI0036C46EC6